MKLKAEDSQSLELKVMLLNLFNWPPHLRHVPGYCLPFFVLPKGEGKSLPTLNFAIQVLVDEIRWLHFHGVSVYDAHAGENITLRGELVRVLFDSRGVKEALGRAEAGKIAQSCLLCTARGATIPDVSQALKADGRYARIGSKVCYTQNWRALPHEGHEVLREACASINPTEHEEGSGSGAPSTLVLHVWACTNRRSIPSQ
jgi:hypothetical protein